VTEKQKKLHERSLAASECFVAKVLNPSFFFCPVQERRQHLEDSEEKSFWVREKTAQLFMFFSLTAATMEGSSGSNLGLIAAEKH
jgi:hypothetical protein